MTASDLTLRKIRRGPTLRGSEFQTSYIALLQGQELSEQEFIFLLSRAVIFMSSSDEGLRLLGYRIVLQYTQVTGDFEPLYQVALAADFAPITEVIGRQGLLESPPTDFISTFMEAHLTNFEVQTNSGTTFRTHGQMALRSYARKNLSTVVVAPTSYGKSELIAERVLGDVSKSSAVVVPTKALIAQTKRMLIREAIGLGIRVRIITHPDEVMPTTPFVAVVTQERLTRMFRLHADLRFDFVLVDEAHNLLSGEPRAEHLAQALITAQHRDVSTAISFFTPFIAAPESVSLVHSAHVTEGNTSTERVKVETLYFSELSTGQLYIYDQLLDIEIPAGEVPSSDVEAIAAFAGGKNLIYLNRPRQAETVATDLAASLGPNDFPGAEVATRAIADLIHPQYSLITCIQHGVIFHHGKVPELIRQYVEQLFSNPEPLAPKFLVTTSTLLEGVNTPADRMFILTPVHGRGNLKPAAFKNLIGRVGRFSEIFASGRNNLHLLQPKIFLFKGSHCPRDANIRSFLKKVADGDRVLVDDVTNPLLENSSETEQRYELLEYLENVEAGTSGLEDVRRANTQIGRLCFANNVLHFDIFENESTLDANLASFLQQRTQLANTDEVIEAISSIFFTGVDLANAPEIERLRASAEARAFYGMFLRWRAESTPFKLMIVNFLRFWESLGDSLVFVGSAWGEHTGPMGFREVFIRMSEKSQGERVNLAVAKIKEEDDFVDFHLMRYVETLNDLSLLNSSLYNRLKYGTDDLYLIALLRHGFSLELARLVSETYSEFVVVLADSSELNINPNLPSRMQDNEENDILIYEIESHTAAIAS